MKVFAQVPPGLSQAMARVERAIITHAPRSVQFVGNMDDADLIVVHVIGFPETEELTQRILREGREYAIVQYCMRTTQQPNTTAWLDIWRKAKLVWSYYDLYRLLKEDGNESFYDDFHFYQSPLGVDSAFTKIFGDVERTIDVMTSGYVSAYCAEAIEEVAYASHSLGLRMQHLGPVPVGFTRPLPGNWSAVSSISDESLAALYRSCKWVSGLRHGEGFELPALEGLACGARPILFDRSEMRQWYDKYGVFVPECHGEELEHHLTNVFKTEPMPLTDRERKEVHEYFDWRKIMHVFWQGLL